MKFLHRELAMKQQGARWQNAELQYRKYFARISNFLPRSARDFDRLELQDQCIERISRPSQSDIELEIGDYIVRFSGVLKWSASDNLMGAAWLCSELDSHDKGHFEFRVLCDGDDEFQVVAESLTCRKTDSGAIVIGADNEPATAQNRSRKR